MKNLIKTASFALILSTLLTSCGKNYAFQKVVVNNSATDAIVHYGCCENEITTVVPAFERRVVFECTYQSFKKPTCDDVNGDFSLTFPDSFTAKSIAHSDNWTSESDGNTVSCIFIIDPEATQDQSKKRENSK